MARLAITTGNKAADVGNKVFIEAEARVLKWLRDVKGFHVADNRKARTFYDFVINHAYTLDVKSDTQATETGRVAIEMQLDNYVPVSDEYGTTMAYDSSVPGWGRHHGLNYIAYVELSNANKWPVYIVHLPNMVAEMDAALAGHIEGDELKQFVKQDGETRRGIGYAVSLDWLRRKGCIVEEAEV